MSLASATVNNPVIDILVQSSLGSENKELRLKWIPHEEIADIEPTRIDNVYCAIRNGNGTAYKTMITLVLLGNNEQCTQILVSEFARIYSLPTHKYNIVDNNFRRYSVWLKERNRRIKGFIKYDDNYYMVASRCFYQYYSRYGFCTTCGILRCSPVWCICGHKQLSDEWTSNNKKLDDFIKKSQLQTNSPNDAYLEWIPFDCVHDYGDEYGHSYGLPTSAFTELIPLEITDETDDLYYATVNFHLCVMFIE